MAVLVQASGDLESPIEDCGEGESHYVPVDVDPIAVEVDTKRPLKHHLDDLISALDDSDVVDRVNLLYEKPDDVLDVRIRSLLRKPYDMFVRDGTGHYTPRIHPDDDHKRFSVRQNTISYKGQRLSSHVSVAAIFGDAKELQVTYVGTPDVAIPSRRDDRDVLRAYTNHVDEKTRKELRDYLRPYFPEIDTLTDDVFILRVLRAMTVVSPTYAYGSDVTDVLQTDGYGSACEFTDDRFGGRDDEDIERAVSYLMEKNLVKPVADDMYVDVALWKRKVPDIERRLNGMGYFLDDSVNVGILSTLMEGSAIMSDLYASGERLGLELDGTLEDRIVERLQMLVSQGVVKETSGVYTLPDRYIRPVVSSAQLQLAL
ncbi:MAG: hypothetical protein HYW22_00970 [Candidatus Aenigmarchaeota archaeon]|nr:hypothetical protein [Candidatus Aenigmarchaeota archaeon]